MREKREVDYSQDLVYSEASSKTNVYEPITDDCPYMAGRAGSPEFTTTRKLEGVRFMSLAQCITQAKDFGIWLHERTNEKEYPNTIKNRTAHAIFQVSEDIADAIIVLLGAQLPGPAWSLCRPLFEGYVRGFWLLKYASEERVLSFMNGKGPDFGELRASIPKDAESVGAWIHATADKNLTFFHDLTHGGSEHVKRRIRVGSIEPTYPEPELESLIKLGHEIRLRIGVELLSLLNDEEGLKELHGRVQTFCSAP